MSDIQAMKKLGKSRFKKPRKVHFKKNMPYIESYDEATNQYPHVFGDYDEEAKQRIIGASDMGFVPAMMGKKKMLIRTNNLMDPRVAAQRAHKIGGKVNIGNWDDDGISDVVVINKDGKIDTYNGYRLADSDWAYKREYYDYARSARGGRPYSQFLDEYVYGRTVDPDNFRYIQGDTHFVEGFPKKPSKPSPNKLFSAVIVKPAWDLFYDQNQDAEKINYVKFAGEMYRKLVLDHITPLLLEDPDSLSQAERKVQNRLKNNSKVKSYALKIVGLYSKIKDAVMRLVFDTLLRKHTGEAVDESVVEPVNNFIDQYIDPPIISEEVIDNMIAQYEGESQYKGTRSTLGLPARDGYKSEYSKTEYSKSEPWIPKPFNGAGISQGELTMEDLG